LRPEKASVDILTDFRIKGLIFLEFCFSQLNANISAVKKGILFTAKSSERPFTLAVLRFCVQQ
jgi:hypothetical protein